MFGSKRENADAALKRTDTFIHSAVKAQGDLMFSGSLYFDGLIKGNLVAQEDGKDRLVLGKNSKVTGNVRANKIVVFGTVAGSIYSAGVVSLMPGANVRGDIYYRNIDMRHGASVSGRFHHTNGKPAEAIATVVKKEPLKDEPKKQT